MILNISVPKRNYYAAMADAYNNNIKADLPFYNILEQRSVKYKDNVVIPIYSPNELRRTRSQYITGSDIEYMLQNLNTILSFDVSQQEVKDMEISIPIMMDRQGSVYAEWIYECFYCTEPDFEGSEGFDFDEWSISTCFFEITEENRISKNLQMKPEDGKYPFVFEVYVHNTTKWFGEGITIKEMLEKKKLQLKISELVDALLAYIPNEGDEVISNRLQAYLSTTYSKKSFERLRKFELGFEIHNKLISAVNQMNMLLSI